MQNNQQLNIYKCNVQRLYGNGSYNGLRYSLFFIGIYKVPKGVYWADIFSKSFGYTRSETTNNMACFILGEVALGKTLDKVNADYYINKQSLTKQGCHSTKGMGRYIPSNQVTIDNVIIPQGPIKDTKKQMSLLYNEYIVYDISQILIRYLVVTKNVKQINLFNINKIIL